MLNRCMYISMFEWQQQHWPWHREQVPGHVILTSDTVLHLSFSRGQKGLRSRHSLSEEKEILFEKKIWNERPKSWSKTSILLSDFTRSNLYNKKIYCVFENCNMFYTRQRSSPTSVYIMLLQTFYEKLELVTFWIFYCYNNV